MQDEIVPKEIAKERTQIFSSTVYDLSFLQSFVICLHFSGLQGAYLCYSILNGNLRDYLSLPKELTKNYVS
jgi:hypothetical protein